eukprot:16731-Heterococcus_DN1.PRE.2
MKGAAANLMCYGLRDASLALEKTAFEGSKAADCCTTTAAAVMCAHNTGQQSDTLHAALQERLTALQAEMAKLAKYLQRKSLI